MSISDPVLLSIENLNVRYPDGTLGLKDVSFKIKKGECVLLAGPTGGGKSTLAYALLNIIPKRIRAERTGQIYFQGELFNDLSIHLTSLHLQMVLQNADAMLFGSTVEESIRFGLENLNLPKNKILEKTREAAVLFGLSHLLGTSPLSLSSGEKQRAALASCFVMGSEVFILDEPFTYLDPEGRREFAIYLERLKREGKTVILIEHHFQEAASLVDRIFLMEKSRLSETKEKEVFLQEERFSLSPGETPAFSIHEKRETHPVLLQAEGLCFGYEKDRFIFKDLSFTLEDLPPVLPLLGPNGSGKTTFGLLLAGLLEPAGGSFGFKNSARTLKTGYVFQRPEIQLFCRSVEEELQFGLRAEGIEGAKDLADAMLEKLHLKEKAKVHPQNLSRGEKRRLAFGAALILKPDILILDEPTVGQDAASLGLIDDLIDEFSKKRMRFLILTHDDRFARRVSDTYLYLSKDRKLELKKWHQEVSTAKTVQV
jgi:energy-coupling factor transport system ATP-binding protein